MWTYNQMPNKHIVSPNFGYKSSTKNSWIRRKSYSIQTSMLFESKMWNLLTFGWPYDILPCKLLRPWNFTHQYSKIF